MRFRIHRFVQAPKEDIKKNYAAMAAKNKIILFLKIRKVK
jgi:hypothetical protein